MMLKRFGFLLCLFILVGCTENDTNSDIEIVEHSYFDSKQESWVVLTEGEYLDRGFQNEPSVLKLVIKQQSLNDIYFLEIQNPYLHDVDISCDKPEVIIESVQLPLLGRKTWKIKNNSDNHYSIKLNINSSLKHQVPIRLINDSQFNFSLFLSTVFSGLYLGILLIIIVICLVLYFKIGDNDLRNYVFMVLSVFITQAAVLGMEQTLFQYLFDIRESSLIIFAAHLSVFGSLFFTGHFLKIHQYHRFYSLAFRIIMMVAGIGLVFALLGFVETSYQIIDINNTLTVLAILLVSGAAWRKGNGEGGIMLFAYLIFFIGAILFAFKDLHILPWNYFTQYCMPFGSGIESILITLAIGHKMQMIKKSEQKAILEKGIAEKNLNLLQIEFDKLKLYSIELKQLLLGAQIKPHFISNCLNGITALIASHQYKLARGYLVRFGRMMRGALRKNTFDDVLFFEECLLLHAYCTMEQFRAQNKLEIEFIFDPEINIYRMTIPNLIFQPIVENAIIHGLKHLIDRKPTLSIEITKEDDFLRIIVDDNGIGRVRSAEINEERKKNDENNKHESVGIDLITERIKLILKNPDFKPLSYEDKYDDNGIALGTTATLLLPYKEYDFYHPKEGNNPFDAGFIIEADESS